MRISAKPNQEYRPPSGLTRSLSTLHVKLIIPRCECIDLNTSAFTNRQETAQPQSNKIKIWLSGPINPKNLAGTSQLRRTAARDRLERVVGWS